jgi:hypothetical protein
MRPPNVDREGVVHLPVEGDATLEEAVLIIARHHLHILPLTLNLFSFRQVPVPTELRATV